MVVTTSFYWYPYLLQSYFSSEFHQEVLFLSSKKLLLYLSWRHTLTWCSNHGFLLWFQGFPISFINNISTVQIFVDLSLKYIWIDSVTIHKRCKQKFVKITLILINPLPSKFFTPFSHFYILLFYADEIIFHIRSAISLRFRHSQPSQSISHRRYILDHQGWRVN